MSLKVSAAMASWGGFESSQTRVEVGVLILM